MLSRAPSSQPSPSDEELEDASSAYIAMIRQSFPASDRRLEEIITHKTEDETCREIRQYAEEGWPDKSRLKGLAKLYWPHRGDLSITDDILLHRSRIVIPASLRSDILDKIHEGHLGITKCRELVVWWPNISKQLAELVTHCRECSMNATNRIEPLAASQLPQYPWQKVATDLFELNKQNYVLVINYYSRYIEVARLERTTSTAVINHMKSIFAHHGLPEIVISDNGPQYSSAEFESFSREYKFTHVTSNPMHSSGNGKAERAVRTIKSLLRSAKDPYIMMLKMK